MSTRLSRTKSQFTFPSQVQKYNEKKNRKKKKNHQQTSRRRKKLHQLRENISYDKTYANLHSCVIS